MDDMIMFLMTWVLSAIVLDTRLAKYAMSVRVGSQLLICALMIYLWARTF